MVVHLNWGSREAACEGPCTRQRLTGLPRSKLHCVLLIFILFNVDLSDFSQQSEASKVRRAVLKIKTKALPALCSVLLQKERL